jgi:diguanylate cyclase (GGDEF)-like protein
MLDENVLWHLNPGSRRPMNTWMARVLIVQGNARSRADTADTLRTEGHDVLEAGSADNGVRIAHEQGPEVILLDPMLPDRSGYELYASLQRDPMTLAIPVLFLPGSPAPEPAGDDQVPIGGLDIVTRLGLALRTKALNDELRLADVSLRSAVLTDSLTGLANRRAAEERLRAQTGLARVGMGPLAVVLADLDGFAEVNERCGYAVGDRLLQAFAGLLHESCRGGDTVGRLEAEAFLVLLPGTKLDAAWYVAERVRRRTIAIGAALGPDGPGLTASFGVVEHRPSDTWRNLLDRAEAALARAKRAGRNRCEVA